MFDFHIHTTKSDGRLTPEAVIRLAIKEKLSAIAITDHNALLADFSVLQEKYREQIQLINGVELSCIYERGDNGNRQEIHVVALGFDDERLQETVDNSYFDERSYLNKIKEKLEICGISVPDYDSLKKLYPEQEHLGRTKVAEYMVEHGDAATVEEAMDVYIGSYGQKRAYVDELDYAHYDSLEHNVRAIVESGGIPVLAHPIKYRLSEQESLRLLKQFKQASQGFPTGMEVYYRKYSEEEQEKLAHIAKQHKLLFSRGSDFHGKKGQSLMNSRYAGWECKEKTVLDELNQ